MKTYPRRFSQHKQKKKLLWHGSKYFSTSGPYKVYAVTNRNHFSAYVLPYKDLGIHPTRDLAKLACQKHYESNN